MKQKHTLPHRCCLQRRHVPRSLLRRVIGWTMLGIALLGFVLPVLPGIVFLGIGIVLLGPRDPMLRRIGLLAKLTLRRWSQSRQRHLRSLGQLARLRYRAMQLLLRQHLHQRAAGVVSRRLEVVLLAVSLLAAVAASVVVVLWHTVL